MSTCNVRNPRTGELDYQFEMPSESALADACRQLRTAQPQWFNAGVNFRAEVISQFSTIIARHASDILDALVVDTGRWKISMSEVQFMSSYCKARAEQAVEVLKEVEYTSTTADNISFTQQYVPYQLLTDISPWNYPLQLSFVDSIPALLAGCAVIIKPSEITPRFIEPLNKALSESPELTNVLRVVPGDRTVGQALIELADGVIFTGSVATGRQISVQAAKNFKPAFLELGGKDPAVVLGSANIEHAAHAVMRCGITNTGQACYSTERVYVDKEIADEFVGALCNLAEQIELTYPDPRKGHIGPLISSNQKDIIEQHIADAIENGANILTGGKVEEIGGGLWMRPTIMTNVDHTMKIMQDETFAPILPIMTFETEEQAIQLANDTTFGLSAAVFGSDDDITRVGRQIDAGGIYLNDIEIIGAVASVAEKEAFKHSGSNGTRYGPSGILRYVRKKALVYQKATPPTIESLAV